MILGIDFGGTKIALATADEEGHIFERKDIPTLAHRGAEEAVRRALREAEQLIQSTHEKTQEKVSSVGIATMGITQEDRVLYAPNVPGWENLHLPQMIRDAFPGATVRIENDVKSAAWAELRWGALNMHEPGLFVNLGTGIGIALAVHDTILRGAHGAAGEVAYCPRSDQDVLGARHAMAPLEEFVGGGPIKARTSEVLGEEISAGDLFRRSLTDPRAKEMVSPILRQLAFHLTEWVIMFDPARVVIGGGLVNVKEIIFPALEQALKEFVPFPPALVPARFRRDAGLMGSLAVALSPFE